MFSLLLNQHTNLLPFGTIIVDLAIAQEYDFDKDTQLEFIFEIASFMNNRVLNVNSMKTDTSMNLMLVVFCILLVAFVFFNCRMNDALCKKQAEMEHRVETK